MKPKQLANVLIRILGLSMSVHSVPSVLMNVVYGAGFANNPGRYI
jgi:hypothetical protein